MSQVVRISTELYDRLGKHAKGFETPSSVIERLLDRCEGKEDITPTANAEPAKKLPDSLEIIYYPDDEESFKQELLKTKMAYVLLHKTNGTSELKEWNAVNFQPHSSVNGNLRSGYLRKWEEKGIFKAEISTDRSDFSS